MSPRSAARPLIIGADGQVGGALLELLGGDCLQTVRRPNGAGQRAFALEDVARDPSGAKSLFDGDSVGVVYIAAAMTQVDRCETESKLAFALNRDAPAAIAMAAHAAGAKTVFYSTEYVFDGEDGPYLEEDRPDPLSVYGQSKLEAEAAVQAADPAALILRTTVVYGPEAQGKNFAYQLVAKLCRGERMPVPKDQISSPTYNRDLAAASVALVAAQEGGVFHVAGPAQLNRVEFAERLASACGLDITLIQPVWTSNLNQRARRPHHGGLELDKLQRTLPDLELRDVESAVDDWRAHPRGKAWPS
jgi:dTDP-4-dehydrorhamnose reductase